MSPGSPLRYLPVSIPLASGDQTVVPKPMSPYSGANSRSTLSRVNMLYCGCSIVGGTRPYSRATLYACADLFGCPFRRAPVEHLALMDEIGHGADGFFDGRLRVGPMAEIQIEVIHLEPAQRGVTRFHDVLAAKALLVWLFTAPEHLARHDELIARPSLRLEDFAHDDLRLPGGVGLGVVEEIDARIEGGGHQIAGGLLADLLSKRDPGAKRKRADFQTGLAEAAVFHHVSDNRGQNRTRRDRRPSQTWPLGMPFAPVLPDQKIRQAPAIGEASGHVYTIVHPMFTICAFA